MKFQGPHSLENDQIDDRVSLFQPPQSYTSGQPRHLKKVLITQLCSTLCNPMGYSLPGNSVHGILQARMEWVAIPFLRRSSWLRDRTWVSLIADRSFAIQDTREAWHLERLSLYCTLPTDLALPIISYKILICFFPIIILQVHSFIQKVFIEHLLYTRFFARCWGFSSEQE